MIDQRVLKLTPEMPSYTLTKAALWTATQTLAQALAPRIRVNGIGPGPTFPNRMTATSGMTKEVDGHAARSGRSTPPISAARSASWWRRRRSPGQLLAARFRPASRLADARHRGRRSVKADPQQRADRPIPDPSRQRRAEATRGCVRHPAACRGCRAGARADARHRLGGGRSARRPAPDVIAAAVKTLPNAPGVYRMIDAQGRRALCRQGAQPEEARRQLYAPRRAERPHRAHDPRHRDDGFRAHAHRDRGAAARGQPHQAAAPALQRAAARRQVVPLHPDRRGSRGAGDHEASRRAAAEGQLFRAVRLGRRGRPHGQRAAEGVPDPHLLRRRLSRAARGPACSTRSSAARRPARARSRSTTTASWSTRRRRSCPARAGR